MNLYSSVKFKLHLNKIVKRNVKLANLIDEKLELFKTNKNNPSLRLHKLSGNLSKYWSLSVNRSIRISFQYTKDGILLVDIGPHDQVY
jgi:addiction module RelE/StbE family toxin